ncbi:MAG: citrate lyase holo-[acyl-carrier protein] synthase [Lawsonibacter sp.]
MTIANVTLEEMLQARDERQLIQQSLLGHFQKPLLSFTMNIAGPCKRTSLIEFAFNEGLRRLEQKLGAPLHQQEKRGVSGCEAFLIYDQDTETLKHIAVSIEDADELGRLFDMDVLTPDGEKLSRPLPRCCLICDSQVQICARSRAHALDELMTRTEQILQNFAGNRLADLAVNALLDEARLTPKPGLVDGRNNGAHGDMDLHLMEISAHCLRPFFLQAVQLGMEHPDCMPRLQTAGIAAEQTMLSVTGGVNTHKGALFTLGLFCAALGSSLMGYGELFLLVSELAKAAKVYPHTDTHGDRVRRKHAGVGARAEAISGFPNVRFGVELLRDGSSPLTVLLSLMAQVEDSNLLWRGGPQGLAFVRKRARDILSQPEELREALTLAFDDSCIRRNLSPGGSADLLSAALFLQSVTIETAEG